MDSIEYIPTKMALNAREKVKRIYGCQSRMCIEQRKKTICPHKIQYILYNKCIKCSTRWDKSLRNCPCCGSTLRTKVRKKTPYKD